MSTTMEKTQRILLLVLPLAFLFFILNFPAGLVLYWVTTNLWTTGQGLVTRRLMPKPALPAKRQLAHAAEGRAAGASPPRAAAPAAAAQRPPRRAACGARRRPR